jgi:hypothetical protein
MVKARTRQRRSASFDPLANFVAALKAHGFDPKPTGQHKYTSRCPAHDGDRENITISLGDDGRVLVHCQAHKCPVEAIVAAVGLTLADLFPPRPGSTSRNGTRPGPSPRTYPSAEAAIAALLIHLGSPTARWPYQDRDGNVVAWVVRFDPPGRKKEYRPVSRHGDAWRIADPPGPWPIYRLAEVAGADRIFLVEGEKVADLVHGLGLTATTTAHGAQCPHKTDLAPLADKEVVILPDVGEAGEDYAANLLGLLKGLDTRPQVKIVRLPGLTEDGDDVEQWLRDQVPDRWEPEQCRAELERLADEAPAVDLDAVEVENDWPALALGEQPPVRPFPTDALPPRVADFVRTVAQAVGCAEDFVALPALAVAGAAIGRSASLLLKPHYFATASLYAITIGHPASGKSPAQEAAASPMWEIDTELHDAHRAAMEAYNLEMDAFNAAPKASKPPRPVKPVLESAVVENATVEAIAPILADSNRGLLVARDEAAGWVASFGEYKSGRGSDRQFWLSALHGKPIRVDRRGQPGEPVRVPHPFVSVIGGAPPEMLTALQERDGRCDGLVERLLFAIPDPRPRPRWSDKGIPDETMKEWTAIVRRLRARPLVVPYYGTGREHPHVITFSPEAKARWVDWYDTYVDETNDPTYDVGDLAVDGKLADFAARLILILHLLELACGPATPSGAPIAPVPPRTVEAAVRLWAYFRAHGRRARWLLNKGVGDANARAILAWARRRGEETFTEREVAKDLVRFGGDREALAAALDWLRERHAIRAVPSTPRSKSTRGRKPSPEWAIHPDLLRSWG